MHTSSRCIVIRTNASQGYAARSGEIVRAGRPHFRTNVHWGRTIRSSKGGIRRPDRRAQEKSSAPFTVLRQVSRAGGSLGPDLKLLRRLQLRSVGGGNQKLCSAIQVHVLGSGPE